MLRLFRFWRLGGRDLRLLWFALRHPDRPSWLLPAVSGVLFYAIEPLNVAVPVLGVVDDLVLFPLLLHWLVKLLPQSIQADYSRVRLSRR